MSEAEITPAQATPNAEPVKEAAAATAQPDVSTATAEDTKSAEAKPDATEVKPDALTPEAKPAVPEEYKLAMPEGSKLSPTAIEKIRDFAKSNGLSNEQAQKVLDYESQSVNEFMETQKADLKVKSESWVNEVKADPELGGANFAASAEYAKRALDHYGSDFLKNALETTGLGQHPELLRAFTRIGKDMREDQIIIPGAQGSGRVDPAQALYGKKT